MKSSILQIALSIFCLTGFFLTPSSVQGFAPQPCRHAVGPAVFASSAVSPPTASSALWMSDDDDGSGGASGMSTGVVKWFDTLKGFGFIVPDDGSTDVFVHQTAIKAEGFRSLADGEPVEYEVETDNSGRKKAVNVTGPGGQEVQGAPFRPMNDFDSY